MKKKLSPGLSAAMGRAATFTAVAGLALLALKPGSGVAQDTPPDPADAPAAESSGEYSPAEYGIDRYQKIRGKSPFEFELAKPPAEVAADPFADLSLAGFVGSGDNLTVYLVNAKDQSRVTVYGDRVARKNESGYRVLGVKRGRTLRLTTVLIEKDGQQKELGFDEKLLSSMSGGAGGGAPAPGARPGQPGAPVIRPGVLPNQAVNQAARPSGPYQSPQASIPGRGGQQPPAPAPAQLGGVQQGGQAGVAPVANTAGNANQQLNTMLANPQAGTQPAPAAPPPRRRVVLPTPNP